MYQNRAVVKRLGGCLASLSSSFAFLSKLSSVMLKLGLCKSFPAVQELFCQVAFVRSCPSRGTRGRLEVGNPAGMLYMKFCY